VKGGIRVAIALGAIALLNVAFFFALLPTMQKWRCESGAKHMCQQTKLIDPLCEESFVAACLGKLPSP
jgi:hypothetical protein